MPRFSLNDLLLAILVALGLAVEVTLFNYRGPLPYEIPVLAKVALLFVVFGSGGAMIGIGVLAQFHKKAAGAVFGFVVVGSFFVLYALMGI